MLLEIQVDKPVSKAVETLTCPSGRIAEIWGEGTVSHDWAVEVAKIIGERKKNRDEILGMLAHQGITSLIWTRLVKLANHANFTQEPAGELSARVVAEVNATVAVAALINLNLSAADRIDEAAHYVTRALECDPGCILAGLVARMAAASPALDPQAIASVIMAAAFTPSVGADAARLP